MSTTLRLNVESKEPNQSVTTDALFLDEAILGIAILGQSYLGIRGISVESKQNPTSIETSVEGL